MRSVEFALDMGKEIYVLPHRLGESEATHKLLEDGNAKEINDIDQFVRKFSADFMPQTNEDEFFIFCKNNPNYDEVVAKYPNKLFEAELNGEIEIVNAKIIVKQ